MNEPAAEDPDSIAQVRARRLRQISGLVFAGLLVATTGYVLERNWAIVWLLLPGMGLMLLGLWLSEAEFAAWGWRVPFLVSAVLVAVGLWVRLKISETAAFSAAMEKQAPVAVPLAQLIARYPGALLAGCGGVIACFAIFYLTTAYALAQGTTKLGYNRESFLAVQLGANAFLAIGTVASAMLADRYTPGRIILCGAAATVFLGLLFGPGLASGSLWLVFATLSAAFLTMGFAYGPQGSWLPTLFPVPVRYSGISIAFNGGGIIGGAVTPLIAQMMSAAGYAAHVGLLLSAAGVLTLLGVSLSRPSL